MSTYDPRIVAQALGDLQDQLTRWSSIASETLATATETQRHAKEAVDQAMHNAAILLNRAQDDEESVQKAISSVEAAIEKCATAKSTANQTLQEAQNILKHAIATLQKWEAELEKALAWLARAEARLEKAIREYERARQALRSAEWNLSSAESRYRNCMNNPERRDCGSEAAAVRRAQADVASARTWVAVAEQEVIAAKEEVEQAKARVACCQQAVASATQAVNLAQEAESYATQAVNSAERGLEFAQAAERLVRVAQDKVATEVEVAESIMMDTQAAFSLTDESAIHLRTADAAEDSAQTYSTTARKELAHRAQQLYELNRPIISSASGVSSASSTPNIQSSVRTNNFTDKAGRPITLRSWESGSQSFIRAYDTNKVEVPDTIGPGQAGYANATLEKSYGGQVRVRLNDIVTSSEYRGCGVGGQMLGEVERFARQHGAREIYGSIDSENARNFWASQSNKGWVIVPKGAYGEVHYSLHNEK